MNGPYYIISDNHFSMILDSAENQRREKLFKVFNKIKKIGTGSLIIGGDFFDYWFEYKYVIPPGYESIIDSLKELRESGVSIHYILGNHDYWDFGYLNKVVNINFHKGDFLFNNNNQKILITHGDGLLKNDYAYRFMKKIIRSSIFINLVKLIPHEISFKFANKLSKSSSAYNSLSLGLKILEQ